MSLQASKMYHDLVGRGIVVVTTTTTSTGCFTSVKSVQPHPRLNIDTHYNLSPKEVELLAEKCLPKYKAKAEGVSSLKSTLPTHGFHASTDPSKEEKSKRTMTIDEVSNFRKDVRTIHKNGVANALPSDSLTWMDIGRQDYYELIVRAFQVADKIGNAKAVSRISCDGALTVSNARNLNEWWERASAEQKFTLLTVSKKSGKTPPSCEGGVFSSRYRSRLDELQCPFRGSEDSLVEKEMEEEFELEEDSWEGASL